MKALVRSLLDRTPYLSTLRRQVRAQGEYPAGSYYSPIPEPGEVRDRLARPGQGRALSEVDLQRASQLELLQRIQPIYDTLPLQEQPAPPQRYSLASPCFGYGNGIILHAFLRTLRPRTIVEIGTGSSSMLTLDTIASEGRDDVRATFIDAWPDNVSTLRTRLTPGEQPWCTVLGQRVVDVDAAVFSQLQAGDFLFVASSHVLKCGSDVERILFDILPALAVGVTVYFHDIYFPFEYPDSWLLQGRYWNEAHYLRAFLAHNAAWRIRYFNQYAAVEFKDHLERHMPLILRNPGTGLYLERVA